ARVLHDGDDGDHQPLLRALRAVLGLPAAARAAAGADRDPRSLAAVPVHAQRAGRADGAHAGWAAGRGAARRTGVLGGRDALDRAPLLARRPPAFRGGRGMRRYLRLLLVQLRVSAAAAMAYRANFLLEGLMSAAWLGLTLLPLIVLYRDRESVNGWDAP